jgi:RHS repeat-associated protein
MNIPFLGSKERDIETGLDYFGERYYSSLTGRFTSVDPLMASAKTGDPQTWNRYTYALNNPLRYVDPDGMQTIDAWSLLNWEERNIIKSKIERNKGESYRKAFNRIIGGGTKDEVKNKVTLVKNFIDSAGGHGNSAVWQQVKSITGVWLGQDQDKKRNDPRFHEGGGLSISVNDKDKFIEVLGKNGYAINVWYETFGTHPNDSARQITNTSWETGMHLANDDSSDLAKFYVHWDKRSSEFKNTDPKYWTRLGEQKDAGNSHHEPFTAHEVRQKLKQQGIVPRNER